jgi:hypothetical protein
MGQMANDNPNMRELFLRPVIHGFLDYMEEKVTLRGLRIPHVILHTGDDSMWLDRKGHDMAKDFSRPDNEDWIYHGTPRCIVRPGGLSIQTEELSNNASRGTYLMNGEDWNAEFRRIPVRLDMSLTYFTDTFTDLLWVWQALVSEVGFLNYYEVDYMGGRCPCGFQLADPSTERLQGIDGLTFEERDGKLDLEIGIETAFPVFFKDTAQPDSKRIASMKQTVAVPGVNIRVTK